MLYNVIITNIIWMTISFWDISTQSIVGKVHDRMLIKRIRRGTEVLFVRSKVVLEEGGAVWLRCFL